MSTDPSASPTQEAATTPEALARPNGPTDTEPLSLHTETVSNEPAPASSPKRLARADWVRIAIFGIPYASFFLLDIIPTSVVPESWNVTLVNVTLDSIFLVLALALFGREFLSAFSYLRRRPIRKIALLFSLSHRTSRGSSPHYPTALSDSHSRSSLL